MAELTDEEKIVIGVCVGVGAIVLIAIIVVLCYICMRKEKTIKKRRPHFVKERFVDEYRPAPYDPIPIPYPPPRPYLPSLPPTPPRQLIKVPTPRPVSIQYTDPYEKVGHRYQQWDGVFRQEPIVIPLAEPEFRTDGRYMQDPETIYLKYNDDQALLRTQNVQRRMDYDPVPVQRARSFTGGRTITMTKRETPYVGEWYRRPDDLNAFNKDALKSGRDPFLWNDRRF